jgi:RNA polymerase sigma-70 factor (ECF subfamily)
MPNPVGNHETLRRARFDTLFEECHRPLLAYAARRCPSMADAEDVVAEVFVVAWRRLDDVPPGGDALPWLYGVARRTLANQRRGLLRRARLAARLEQDAHTAATTATAAPITSPAGEAALVALARLKPSDQEILRLVAWEELTHAEIATVLGISVNAVAIRLHRARSRFEAALLKGPTGWRTWTWVKGSMSRRATREEP